MAFFDIPEDCLDFLKKNKDKIVTISAAANEIEKVIFCSIEELEEDYQIIDSNEYYLNYNEFPKDPELQYHLPAINLVKTDAEDNYDSDGLLVWIPFLKYFGTFDIDHCIGYIFKDITWKEIERKLGAFVNTQWDPGKSKNLLLKPWKDQGLNIDFDQYKK
ncbi:MAG: hypothetical protein MJB14_03885 [Spirochaetes bacterium]|nr:hypothetical protein [Spirochaetota bacterium]